jgi:hypothetical protein
MLKSKKKVIKEVKEMGLGKVGSVPGLQSVDIKVSGLKPEKHEQKVAGDYALGSVDSVPGLKE